jgi:S-adenosylmethionine hydrolase
VFDNFARKIADVYAVRPARIAIEHTPGRRRIKAAEWVEVVEREPVAHDETVSCAIPGYDHPGREVVTEIIAVREPQLEFEVRGRCGFATDYEYRSDDR